MIFALALIAMPAAAQDCEQVRASILAANDILLEMLTALNELGSSAIAGSLIHDGSAAEAFEQIKAEHRKIHSRFLPVVQHLQATLDASGC